MGTRSMWDGTAAQGTIFRIKYIGGLEWNMKSNPIYGRIRLEHDVERN